MSAEWIAISNALADVVAEAAAHIGKESWLRKTS